MTSTKGGAGGGGGRRGGQQLYEQAGALAHPLLRKRPAAVKGRGRAAALHLPQQAHAMKGSVQLELSNHSLFEVAHVCAVSQLNLCVVRGGLPRKHAQAARAGAAEEGLGHKGWQQRRRSSKRGALGEAQE